jgi:uncharacterized protein YecE (DUF72 family)
VYCRLHGSKQLYASGYGPKAIAQWADRVRRWRAGQEVNDGKKACGKDARPRGTRDVYVFFDNDAKVRAPFDAQALMKAVERAERERAAA